MAGKILVILNTSPGNLWRMPIGAIPETSLADEDVELFMESHFQAFHDKRYVESHPRNFTDGKSQYEIMEVPDLREEVVFLGVRGRSD